MDSIFLDACALRPTARTPVWFLRQAGRYQPEYRAIREHHGILEICRTPELVTEVTLLPVQQFDLDASIVFSDIMIPVAAMGVDLAIDPGVGPVIAEPLRTRADVERLHAVDLDDLDFLDKAIRMLVAELKVPLIGFAGGPFTLASYLIEGGSSKTFAATKALMLGEPDTWAALLDRLSDTVIAALRLQVAAGASAVQLFDSWAGALAPGDYERSVLPWSTRILSELADLGVPRIHFGVNTGELLGMMGQAGADVVGADWRVLLDDAWERVGHDKAVQGNLDPAVLFAPWEAVQAAADDVLRRAAGRPGHIFNLGHGIQPGTPVQTVKRLTEYVHDMTARAVEGEG